MPNPLRSIRVRLTLWHVVALALLLAAFSAGVYFALRGTLRENLDEGIQSRMGVLLPLVEVADGRPSFPLEAVPREIDDDEGEPDDEELVRLFDNSGGTVLDASDPEDAGPIDSDIVLAALGGDERWFDLTGGDDNFRVLIVPVERDGEIAGALAVGESEEDIQEALDALLTIITVAYPLALLAAGGVGIFLSYRALAPIDRITTTAREISAADLSRRLDLDLPDDELGRLARTFDGMLARLDDAFRRQRQFTADASHELRTPLSIMKGQIEVALSRPRSSDTYVETLEAAAEQTDRLINLTTSLLTLARADAGQIPIQREPISLSAIVESTVDQVRPFAGERGVRLEVSGDDRVIEADATLMIQLLLNLLDNAIKHTPPGGVVRVSWEITRDRLHLEVSDTGAGIPPEHLPHIFDRFYRVDTARTREEGGAGIGLSISQWIATAHGGAIFVESAVDRGSTFRVEFPARHPSGGASEDLTLS